MHSIHYCCSSNNEVEGGVAFLIGSQLWHEATAVRNASNPRTSTFAHSPGLVMLLQPITASGDEDDKRSDNGDATSALACCLIQHSIDRVCVIRGGAKALLDLPQITDYFVSPHI